MNIQWKTIMKTILNKNLSILLMFLLPALQAAGQTAAAPNQKVTPPSPEASVIQKYGEYGCSGYTGRVDITVPLFDLKI